MGPITCNYSACPCNLQTFGSGLRTNSLIPQIFKVVKASLDAIQFMNGRLSSSNLC
jgi:hypothetical protein